jgi:hypothetical protein
MFFRIYGLKKENRRDYIISNNLYYDVLIELEYIDHNGFRMI